MLDLENLYITPNPNTLICEDSPGITEPQKLPGHICPDPNTLIPAASAFGMRITPYFLNLIQNPNDALARQVLPDLKELEDPATEYDPLAEEAQSPAPLIIHRYPHRVIFRVTNQCAVHCRFCMRKRRVGSVEPVSADAIDASLHYIHSHPEINEVILSGGDPLMLSNTALKTLLEALHQVPHLKILRLHTRIASVWPQRITPSLVKCLSLFHPLYLNIHFNHPAEITHQADRACQQLADAGIPLGSQTVLLKGINDEVSTLVALFEKLLAIRVRPYYLHQLDRVPGTAHFNVPIEKSLALVKDLRGRLSGMGMPHFMVDLPGGGGKVELLPESRLHREKDHLIFTNYQGRDYRYPID